MTAWTNEQIAQLIEAREKQGLPFREIGRRLGRGASTCAEAYHRFTWRAKKSATREVIAKAILEAAEAEAWFPSNTELALLANVSVKTIKNVLPQIEQSGPFKIRQRGNQRAAMVIATGAKTRGYDRLGDFYEPISRLAPAQPFELAALSLRVPCPYCGCRLDADPSLCCARGREMRKVAA